MKYGFCTGFASVPLWDIKREMLDSILSSGYDYPECTVMTYARMDEKEYSSLFKGVRAPVACNLFPGDVLLSENGRSLEKISEYLDVALPRSRAIGIEKIVFGSGKARRRSDETEKKDAWRNLREAIDTVIVPKAKEWNTTILIEPLTRGECNLINTVEEGYALSKSVGDDSLLLMADIFHMKNNSEPLSSLEKCFDRIRHIHIAGRERRLEDTLSDPFILEALNILKSLGYNDTISFETTDGEKKEALDRLKEIFS